MVYDLIVASGHQERIDEAIGECIYAGVVSDTGSFRFPSAQASVHTLVADLKSRGLQHSKVHENLFDNFLENKLRFTGHVLLHRMEVIYEYNTALVAISKNDLLKYYIKTGDTEGLVNFPQSIQGIKLVGLVIDRDEERKWSFRSKGDFDCNAFARKYFIQQTTFCFLIANTITGSGHCKACDHYQRIINCFHLYPNFKFL
jgi:phosphoesterase RecJ-like protein